MKRIAFINDFEQFVELTVLRLGNDSLVSLLERLVFGFIYKLVFLSVAALGAGRILGLDTYVEQYEVDGHPLIQRHPVLEHVLG